MAKRPSKVLVRLTLSAIRSGIKTAPRNKPRTLKQICGANSWLKLNDEERRHMGKVVQKMALKGLVGLIPIGTNGANAEVYIVP